MRRHIQILGLLFVFAASVTAACGGGGPESSGAPASAAPTVSPVDPATAGSIAGTVTFEGTPPAPEALKVSSDPYCEGASPNSTSQAQLVGPGGGLQNVFVYVKDGLGTLAFPIPSTPVVLDQKGCHYTPRVLGIQIGQPLEVVNSDATLHNVHAVATANREFNTGQPIQGMKTTHTFSTKEVMVPFKCDVHGWMNAWVGVLDHPFHAVTAADGAFSLKGLPPGTYTLEAWHEKLGRQSQTVTIGSKEDARVAFTFKAP